MDQITNSPGLQHITEDILLNLDFKNLKICQSINKKFGEILTNPIFWLKKFRLITRNPGLQSLQQINEDVFLDFDLEDLEYLQSMNKTFEEIFLENSTICFKKYRIRELLRKIEIDERLSRKRKSNWQRDEEELMKHKGAQHALVH